MVGDDGDDGDDGGESIGERVKLKKQNKINKKEFEEKYATGFDYLDQIIKQHLNRTYNPKPGKEATFMGFKKIIDVYKNGYKSHDDIVKEQINLLGSLNDESNKSNNDINKNINFGYNKLLSYIFDGVIKVDEKAVIKSIEDMNQRLINKNYYTINSKI